MSQPTARATQPREPSDRPRQPKPCTLILFGVTGDLSRRKLLPAIYELSSDGLLPENFAVVGFSRNCDSVEELRSRLRAGVEEHARTLPVQEEAWDRIAGSLYATTGGAGDPEAFERLRALLEEVDAKHGTEGRHLYYFATPASIFPMILENMKKAGLLRRASGLEEHRRTRVIIEKPFGTDLESAAELNRVALSSLDEDQVYRIDHYLGKETVQNILVFRFGNAIFEPLWNRQHIDHVEITMAESIDVEGRGAFYEETGVVRDIVQNHLLQILALCAMEAPVSFRADEIRNMKAQVLRSLRPIYDSDMEDSVVFGQYEGYREDKGTAPDSKTPTFLALKTHIDNWRWQGVPFYLRAGKGLAARQTEIAIHFKQIPFCLFGEEDVCQSIPSNVLKLRIQPNEGIRLGIAAKVPGDEGRIGKVDLDFYYSEVFGKDAPAAYERLLLDWMRGDPTLFARKDEVELSWKFVEPLLHNTAEQIQIYEKGSQGPAAAADLLRKTGHRWEELSG